MPLVRIKELPQHIGERVTVNGWLYNKRESGKLLFPIFRDGAGLIQGVVAIIMVLVLRDFDTLTTYFVVVEWAALIFAVGAVFVLRRKLAAAPRPFRTPAYPWVPLVFVVGTVVGLSAIVWGQIQVGNFSPMYGLGIAAAGFPVHYLWKRLKRSQ